MLYFLPPDPSEPIVLLNIRIGGLEALIKHQSAQRNAPEGIYHQGRWLIIVSEDSHHDIPGICGQRKKELLRRFESLKKNLGASVEELPKVTFVR